MSTGPVKLSIMRERYGNKSIPEILDRMQELADNIDRLSKPWTPADEKSMNFTNHDPWDRLYEDSFEYPDEEDENE